MARRGAAWHGQARHGKARNKARRGLARQGGAGQGKARNKARRGVAWLGQARQGKEQGAKSHNQKHINQLEVRAMNIKKAIATTAAALTITASMASYAMAQKVYTTVSGYPFAISRTILDKATSMLAAGDNAAFITLVRAGVAGITKAGVRVYITDTAILSGVIKVRPVGSTGELWTLIDAVK